MRKTRVRRRFRKRATPRKTRKNIHKSKKHINSRRYSRRRVMRGGVPIDINKFFNFNSDTVLLGYGKYNKNMTFILYSAYAKKFYYFYNKKIEHISSSSNIFIYLPIMQTSSLEEVGGSNPIVYNEDHLDKITSLFDKNNITYEIKFIETNETDIEKNPINIEIENKYFLNFGIAHNETYDKNVLFAQFMSNGFLFLFQDKSGIIFQNNDIPTEDSTISVYNPITQIINEKTSRIIREAHEAQQLDRIKGLFR